ncbi:hypothetical protein FA13DRAFT_1455997 [Coprinellus micaceus]|uniref:Uncharacterized protein n=1 Tax=Coprinellus micaceus TaxID=71717 RepID=A0A4Y7SNF4_COPMI|nr:hypothetical protein FA13DRAFT_1455997 [Coprinellus micaceus]
MRLFNVQRSAGARVLTKVWMPIADAPWKHAHPLCQPSPPQTPSWIPTPSSPSVRRYSRTLRPRSAICIQNVVPPPLHPIQLTCTNSSNHNDGELPDAARIHSVLGRTSTLPPSFSPLGRCCYHPQPRSSNTTHRQTLPPSPVPSIFILSNLK